MASAANDNGVRNFVAFVAYADQVQIVFPGCFEFGIAVSLTGIGTDGPAHAEEDCAAAAILQSPNGQPGKTSVSNPGSWLGLFQVFDHG